MTTFHLAIELTGAGWAEASVEAGDARATLTASYLSDAPRDLVEAAIAVAGGADEASCSWAEEPGEHRWRMRREGGDLEVEILGFDRLWGQEPDESGRVVFYARVRDVDFVRSVLRSMDALAERFGTDGYAERWGRYDYPGDQVERLREALATMVPRPSPKRRSQGRASGARRGS
jgi:hypothetical protein